MRVLEVQAWRYGAQLELQSVEHAQALSLQRKFSPSPTTVIAP
ncbi:MULTISPECIES: hypothetical protein [Pseudomonas]|nr:MULTISPECIES: hypothetical protein [unclassified Pseudomonas]